MEVGIIGYRSKVSKEHTPCYRKLKANVAYIADSSEKRLTLAKNNERCKGYFQDYQKILENKEVDLVDICTQSSLTPQICLDAAKSGKNFIVEPPFAFSSQQAKEIIATAEKNKVKGCIALSYRFKPAIYPIIMKKRADEFGKIFAIHVTDFEVSPRLNSKVPPVFKFPYAIDALTFFGGKAKKVLAKSPTMFEDPKNYPNNILEPEMRALIEFDGCCTGFLDWSAYSAARHFTIDVFGTGYDATINVAESSSKVLNWWWDPGPRIEAAKAIFKSLKLLTTRYDRLLDSGYIIMLSEFLKSIENDTPSPVPLPEGERMTALIEGINQSILSGSEVDINAV